MRIRHLFVCAFLSVFFATSALADKQSYCEVFGQDFANGKSPEVDQWESNFRNAFGDCMAGLASRDLIEPIREWVLADRPFLGICIGYQVLFDGSEETPDTPGLGLLPGHVVRFGQSDGLKIPHMGWNAACPCNPADPIWNDLGSEPYFYFVHSYFPQPADPSVVAARTRYGCDFASAARRGNLFAVQFHPEKSQHAGQRLLRNFLDSTLPDSSTTAP